VLDFAHKKNRSVTGGYIDGVFVLSIACRQAEFFSYKPTKWAIPQTKIIVVTTLFEPHQQVHVAAALACFHFI